MTDRICIPLPDGRWLALDKDAFEAALAAGSKLDRKIVPSAKPEEMLTAEELATRLKLSPSWIEQATRDGRLPYHHFGRYRRYSVAAVLEATAQQH
jgi:excisionase family DNA binding protein